MSTNQQLFNFAGSQFYATTDLHHSITIVIYCTQNAAYRTNNRQIMQVCLFRRAQFSGNHFTLGKHFPFMSQSPQHRSRPNRDRQTDRIDRATSYQVLTGIRLSMQSTFQLRHIALGTQRTYFVFCFQQWRVACAIVIVSG
jgi:hypothetical protein